MRLAILRPYFLIAFIAVTGCGPDPINIGPLPPPPLPSDNTPEGAIRRFVAAYERRQFPEYRDMFTGDFTYEFSNSTDPALVQQYSTGWFKNDEKESAFHLFGGYTPPGGATLEPADAIDISLALTTPTDDNSSGIDPVTHKVLATRVDGRIDVPQPGSDAITYLVTNNYNVFYVVRGDVAVNLDSTQVADSEHWYLYRWVDLTGVASSSKPSAKAQTWGALKAAYH